MSFEKHLQKASYRGIKFHVTASERVMGFNYKLHIFPGNKRKAFAEQVSEEPQVLPLEAFLIGKDAQYTRDLLISACRKRTPGKLLHPQIGYIDAYCKSFRIREVFDRIGKIMISMEFIEAPKKSLMPDFGIIEMIKEADKLLDDALVSFNEAMSVLDLPAYGIASLAKTINKLSSFVTSSNGLGRIPETAVDIKDSLLSLKDEFGSLLKSPSDLGGKLVKTCEYLIGEEALEASNAFSTSALKDMQAVENSFSESEKQEKLAQLALDKLISFSCIAAMSRSDSKKTINDVNMAINRLILVSNDYEYQALSSLKTEIGKKLAKKDASKSASFRLQASMPSLVLAYDLNHNLESEQSIILQNQDRDSREIFNPAVVSGDIRIKSHGA